MLFINKLINTQSKTIYAAVYDFLHNNGIPLSNLSQIATDGASAMTGKHNGFVATFKEVAPPYNDNLLHYSSATSSC